ncbi:hypothetical protein AYO44_17625 [Planctomycetaceae bacterium SCGC AG-212-F19]|nr:hypothetical protein AYO44_17625 [Planctomycetaceae bacterium SCGC AG-212-F19]
MATNVPSGFAPAVVPADETSLTTLVSGIVTDAQELLKQQVALLKHDIRSEIRQTKEAVTALAVGGAIAALGAILLAFMVVHLLFWLVPAVPLWGWFAIVGAAVTVAGVILIYAGVRRFSEFHPLPENTVAALRENLRWTTRPSTSGSR